MQFPNPHPIRNIVAAASVLITLSTINQKGGILPPSALVQHIPRHWRSRAYRIKGKGGRGRGYSVHEDRDVTITKAAAFVLKRSVPEREAKEDDAGAGHLHSDDEAMVSVADLLEHNKIDELGAMLEDLRRIVDIAKARFTLRQLPSTDAESPEAYQVRPKQRLNSVVAPLLVGKPLTQETENLPEFIDYDTTYRAYPLILLRRSPRHSGRRPSPAGQNAGLLFEDGEARQEAPEALRKTAKGKGERVKVSLQGSGADDSGRAVESDCVMED
ncbi:hypothetical protein DL767_001822 [Monosporascus sp. MG133]|nr:hypothetical protein DL767_001822 [Monosporascus sp. MG133]